MKLQEIPESLSIFFILAASVLCFVLMIAFVAQNFTGIPQVRSQIDEVNAETHGSLSDLNSRVTQIESQLNDEGNEQLNGE